MKMKKAMKKLKFWSSSKKKKKNHNHNKSLQYNDQLASCHCHYHHCCHHYYPVVEPSAPPLPSSYNPKVLNYEFEAPLFVHQQDPFQDSSISSEYEEVKKNVNSSYESYQQYMDPNPVFDVPVEHHHQVVKRERGNVGAFGCVFSYGVHLFRCFFPCFHIKHVD